MWQPCLQLLGEIGVTVRDEGDTLHLCARDARFSRPRPELFQQVRGWMLLAGPMLSRFGQAIMPLPGGDRIGRRRVDTHLLALEALGARIDFDHYDFAMRTAGLHGADILLDEASVTGTENAVMAAVLAKGTTIIRNAASEPHVQDLCQLLNCLGAQIEGIGTNTLTIQGVDRLGAGEFTISPDYLEVGSFLGLGAVTRGEIRIHGVVPEHMRMINFVFAERLGVQMRMEGDILIVGDEQNLRIREDIGGAVPKIDDAPWPQFPADLMSIALVVATQAQGTVLIHEKMFESRLYFVDKLIGMGAKIILCDPHRAVIVGPSPLHGQELSSPDIRAGMALLIAALAAREHQHHRQRRADRSRLPADRQQAARARRAHRAGERMTGSWMPEARVWDRTIPASSFQLPARVSPGRPCSGFPTGQTGRSAGQAGRR